jgi:hypothetical protein
MPERTIPIVDAYQLSRVDTTLLLLEAFAISLAEPRTRLALPCSAKLHASSGTHGKPPPQAVPCITEAPFNQPGHLHGLLYYCTKSFFCL